MRLLLDARISGAKVGRPLQDLGRDVLATETTERVPDDALLELAGRERRIIVTHNARDFLQPVRRRPIDRPHAGVILVPNSIARHQFGVIIAGVLRTLGHLSQEEWVNRVEWLRGGD